MTIATTRSMEQLRRFVVNKLKAQMPGVLLVSLLTAGLPAAARSSPSATWVSRM